MDMTRLIRWGIAVAACCCLMMCATWDATADDNATSNTPKIDNVGFMKNPPKELVDRFPMCDAFLNVEWIDPTKGIGLIDKFSLYKPDGELGTEEAESIVSLEPKSMYWKYSTQKYYPSSIDDSRMTDFKKNELRNLFPFIRDGKVRRLRSIFLRIEKNDKSVEFVPYEYSMDWTLAKNSLNVCIPYPDNRNAWIVEGKEPKFIMEKQQIVDELKEAHVVPGDYVSVTEWLNYGLTPIDINNDGRLDYIGPTTLFYSVKNEYYQIVPGSFYDDKGCFYFPPWQKNAVLIQCLLFD